MPWRCSPAPFPWRRRSPDLPPLSSAAAGLTAPPRTGPANSVLSLSPPLPCSVEAFSTWNTLAPQSPPCLLPLLPHRQVSVSMPLLPEIFLHNSAPHCKPRSSTRGPPPRGCSPEPYLSASGTCVGAGKCWEGRPGCEHTASTIPGSGPSLGSACGGTGLATGGEHATQLKERPFK